MVMIKPITEKEYQKLVEFNKNKSEEYLFQWAGYTAYEYPITIEQIKSRNSIKDSQIFSVFNDKEMIGSIELDRIDYDTLSAKVCRFILSDEFKNKGFGTSALNELANIAFNTMKLRTLTLCVFCYNVSAMRCYEKCGFLVKEFHQREDPKWNSYTMELRDSFK